MHGIFRSALMTVMFLPLLTHGVGARELLDSNDAIVNTGHTLFQAHCAACHGEDARGGGVDTGFETARVADLTALAKKNDGVMPLWALYDVISGTELLPAHGASRQMPIWGQALQHTPGLSADNAAAVVRGRIFAIMAYLSTVQER